MKGNTQRNTKDHALTNSNQKLQTVKENSDSNPLIKERKKKQTN